MRKWNRILGIVMAASVAVTGVMLAGSSDAYAKKKKKKATPAPTAQMVDLDGTYHAALGVQTDTKEWIYRIGYYHDEYAGKDEWKHLATGSYGTKEYKKLDGDFTDVKIKGNGTYTVSLDNADFMDETEFSQMQVATDIPDTGSIKFSNMVVTVNGIEKGSFEEPYIDKDSFAGGNVCLLAINHWRPDLVGINPMCVPSGKENNISITFTVSGFNYDNPDAKATPAPQPVAVKSEGKEKAAEQKDVTIPVLAIIGISVVLIIGITVHVSKKRR